MKRILETSQEIVVPEDCLLSILPYLVDCGVVCPRKLLGWYSITKRIYQIWKDRDAMSHLFLSISEKNMELFDKERNGIHLANYFYARQWSQVFSMADRLWKEFILKIDPTGITQDDYGSRFNFSIHKQMKFAELLGPISSPHGSRTGSFDLYDQKLIEYLSSYMVQFFGWKLVSLQDDYNDSIYLFYVTK